MRTNTEIHITLQNVGIKTEITSLKSDREKFTFIYINFSYTSCLFRMLLIDIRIIKI